MKLLTQLNKEHLDRRLYQYSKINSVITYITTKNRYPLLCESYLEFDALHLGQFDPDITFLDSQPISVYWLDEQGNRRRYTSDILKLNKKKEYFIDEVKPEEKLRTSKNLKKYDQIADAFAKEGIDFSIKTENDIYQGANIDNFHLLHRYLDLNPPKEVIDKIKKEAATNMSLLQYAELCSDLFIESNIIFSMIATHSLTIDFTQPIQPTIEIIKGAA